MIYVNLWYDMYYEKTNAQIKSFRKLGFATHVMTIDNSGNAPTCKVINASNAANPSENEADVVTSFSCNNNYGLGYTKIFRCFFDWVISENYDFIYIRRLMSKIAFAAPYFKKLSKSIPIVYEIPTYPFDKTYSLKLSLRDNIEWIFFRSIEKYLRIVPAVLCKEVKLKENWLPFLNMIDIDNYGVTDIPAFTDTINFLAVSNMHKSHCYERILYALRDYNGKYNVHLTMISSETDVYKSIKNLAKELELTDIITFLPSKSVSEVKEIASNCHIGVGRLTYGEKDRTIDTSLKNKDYCAMGLPFISSLTDLSFPAPFEYHYLVSNNTYDIDLEPIIEWYINIRRDLEYKTKMYNYAKEKLQYDDTAVEIINILSAP